MIDLPETPKPALTVKFLKLKLGRYPSKKARLFFLSKGKVYAMTLDFPGPVDDPCLSQAFREGKAGLLCIYLRP
jgi:hypothetical protein